MAEITCGRPSWSRHGSRRPPTPCAACRSRGSRPAGQRGRRSSASSMTPMAANLPGSGSALPRRRSSTAWTRLWLGCGGSNRMTPVSFGSEPAACVGSRFATVSASAGTPLGATGWPQ